jgi:uracil-DNA glycosylase
MGDRPAASSLTTVAPVGGAAGARPCAYRALRIHAAREDRRRAMVDFDPGYGNEPFAGLVADYPGEDVYPPAAFRTEWGPIFHRGRLDGTARVLVIGQDPAAHESIARRVLVGEAGQRVQGFLARLGVDRSYVVVNALLYAVYGQAGGSRHVMDPGVVTYRHRWLDAVAATNQLDAIVAFGTLAGRAYQGWKATPAGGACSAAYAQVVHPTYPESASASGTTTKAEAMARLTASWNAALTALHPVVRGDRQTDLVPYGARLTTDDLAPIPAADLPPGLPAWMRSLAAWATRTGEDASTKRAQILVAVPRADRTWPPVT